MALSSKWSQAVVVRADQGEVVVAPPSSALPSSSSARAYAAAGNPIVIRARDSNHILCRTDAEQSTQRNGGGLHAWLTVGTRDVVGCTFWVPEGTQMGLLETLYRKGAANTLPTLLQSRPLEELQYNFSTCTGQNIDLSHNAFRLSKTAMALHNMDAALGEDDSGEDGAADVGDGSFGGGSPTYGQQGPVARTASRSRAPASRISMTTREFKQSLRCSLQSLQEEDYYVVKYRDYSTWAVTEYSSLTKSDRFLGKKYVEQCFAVHVGREPGELLPITESQFLFAVDLLQRQLMNQLTSLPAPSSATGAHDVNRRTYEQYQLDINYCALNVDQFKSLWAILGEGLRTVHVEGEEQKRSQQLKQTEDAVRQQNLFGNAWSADPLYKAPAWYDWRPSAVRMRVQHQMTLYYTSVGRFTVQLLLLGCCGYLIYRTAAPHLSHAFGGASADKRKRSGSRGGYDDYDDDFVYPRRRPGFLRSALMGPKDMLDYLLAPAEV